MSEKLNSTELLAPAGSFEAVVAAVKNGADAVYLGGSEFNARINAKNFSRNEIISAFSFCFERNVKVYVTLNTLMFDNEMQKLLNYASFLYNNNVSAVIVQDLGVAALLQKYLPKLEIHASTQMCVHNLDGVIALSKAGFSRAVLARELSLNEIKYICKNSPIDIEIFIHGALCMSYSGACFMSSIIGTRSGNRGMCAQPCRLAYKFKNKKQTSYPLSLKDLCAIDLINDIKTFGNISLKIEGRMKRPEYVGAVTRAYRKAIDCKAESQDKEHLAHIFSRNGFTNGYLTNSLGNNMFGIKKEEDRQKLQKIYKSEQKFYSDNKEYPHVPIDISYQIKNNADMEFTFSDSDGNSIKLYAPPPLLASDKPSSEKDVSKYLSALGGTYFYINSINGHIDSNLFVKTSQIKEIRRNAIKKLLAVRNSKSYAQKVSLNNTQKILLPKAKKIEYLKNKRIYAAFNIKNNLPDKNILKKLDLIILNFNLFLELINDNYNFDNIKYAVDIPQFIHEDEMPQFKKSLKQIRKYTTCAICNNIGTINILKKLDFNIIGGNGLNITNSYSLEVVKNLKISEQIISFETNLYKIRDMSKCIECACYIYGKMKLMTFKNCIIKNNLGCINKSSGNICFSYLKDRKNENFLILRDYNCKNSLYNSKKLYMLDNKDFTNIGLSSYILSFTDEKIKEVINIIDKTLNFKINNLEPVNNTEFSKEYTRGLYNKKI